MEYDDIKFMLNGEIYFESTKLAEFLLTKRIVVSQISFDLKHHSCPPYNLTIYQSIFCISNSIFT